MITPLTVGLLLTVLAAALAGAILFGQRNPHVVNSEQGAVMSINETNFDPSGRAARLPTGDVTIRWWERVRAALGLLLIFGGGAGLIAVVIGTVLVVLGIKLG
jgi:hypothetical protein